MGTYELIEDANRVEVAVQGQDENVVIEKGKAYETDDPTVMAILDEHPAVQRSQGKKKGAEG